MGKLQETHCRHQCNTVKMRDGLQKADGTLATHIRTERIGLNAYLHSRNVPGTPMRLRMKHRSLLNPSHSRIAVGFRVSGDCPVSAHIQVRGLVSEGIHLYAVLATNLLCIKRLRGYESTVIEAKELLFERNNQD